jgi:NAD(P)-dependent dehydrogenase (short-subunit alcohol dehydrogenase family)
MPGRLLRKVAIVTGGGSGIGLAIAKAYAREGARVYVADISPDACDRVAANLGEAVTGEQLDVCKQDSIDGLIAKVVSAEGRIDILVNAAGVFGMQMIADITAAEFDRIIGVNTRGLAFMIQAAAKQMIAQASGGAMKTIASGAGRRASPGAAVYCASKAAAISLTQAAALELVKHQIRVNAIAPGGVRTPMWQDLSGEVSRVFGVSEGAAEDMMVAATPIGRLAEPEEIANVAVFLATDESSYMIGQTVNVDGGLHLS